MINGKKLQEHWDGKYLVREYSNYIIAHQGICHGQLTFKGTRVLVQLVLESLARPGRTIEQVAADYRLPTDAIIEALRLASTVINERLRLNDPHPDDVVPAQKIKKRAPAMLAQAA